MTDRVEEGGIVMRLTVAHVPEIARIHAAAFPDSTVTRLGSRVVEQYYRWQFEAPHEMNALGVYVGSELVGFCLSGVFRGAV